MNKLTKILFSLTLMLGIWSSAYAVQITVPSAPGAGYCLKSLSNGTYGTLIANCSSGSGTGTVSTSSVPTIGGLAYWTSAGYPSLLGTVATTSATCSGTVSCSAFTVIGTSPITITGAAGTSASSTLYQDNGSFTGNNQFTNASTTLLTLRGLTYDKNNSAGTPGFILMTGVSGPTWVATSSINNGVISVATNNGLTGGTITTTGTLGFDLSALPVNNLLLTYNGSQLTATGTANNLTVPGLTATSSTATSTFASAVTVNGATASLAPFAVKGWDPTNNSLYITNGTNSYGLGFINGGNVAAVNGTISNTGFSFRTNATTRATFTAGGNFGIATTTPSNIFSVQGQSLFSGDIVSVANVTATGTLTVLSTATSTFSDPISITSASTTATSTMSGINLPYGGCFAVAGTCVTGGGGSGSGTVTSQPAGSFGYYNVTGTTITGTSSAQLYVGALSATSSNATSTFAGDVNIGAGEVTYSTSTGITSIASLITGTWSADINAGLIQLYDLPIDSNAPVNTAEGYSLLLGGQPGITLKGFADGLGNIKQSFVGIGTSSPSGGLTVWFSTSTAGTIFNVVTSASTTVMAINTSGNAMFSTTSTAGVLNLGNNPATTNASTTIRMSKMQWEGLNSAGVMYCTFVNVAGALTTQAGQCNN